MLTKGTKERTKLFRIGLRRVWVKVFNCHENIGRHFLHENISLNVPIMYRDQSTRSYLKALTIHILAESLGYWQCPTPLLTPWRPRQHLGACFCLDEPVHKQYIKPWQINSSFFIQPRRNNCFRGMILSSHLYCQLSISSLEFWFGGMNIHSKNIKWVQLLFRDLYQSRSW